MSSPVPPCYLNRKCFEHDRLPQWEGRHIPGCTYSATGRAARARAIDALSPAQLRQRMHALSGWAPLWVELALDDAEPVAVLRPEDMPVGAQ